MQAKHYAEKGKRAYLAGIVRIPIAAPRGWQQAAERAGYKQARDEWRAANPGADELHAMREKNEAFCRQALRK